MPHRKTEWGMASQSIAVLGFLAFVCAIGVLPHRCRYGASLPAGPGPVEEVIAPGYGQARLAVYLLLTHAFFSIAMVKQHILPHARLSAQVQNMTSR